jgi:hypothetical protein
MKKMQSKKQMEGIEREKIDLNKYGNNFEEEVIYPK